MLKSWHGRHGSAKQCLKYQKWAWVCCCLKTNISAVFFMLWIGWLKSKQAKALGNKTVKELSSTMVVPHVLPRSLSFNPCNLRAAFHMPTWLESPSFRWLYRSRFCLKKDSNEGLYATDFEAWIEILLLSSQRWLFRFHGSDSWTSGCWACQQPVKKLPRKLGSQNHAWMHQAIMLFSRLRFGLGYTGIILSSFNMGTITSYCKESSNRHKSSEGCSPCTDKCQASFMISPARPNLLRWAMVSQTLPWSAFGSGHGGRVYPAKLLNHLVSKHMVSNKPLGNRPLGNRLMVNRLMGNKPMGSQAYGQQAYGQQAYGTASLCAANATSTISATLWSSRSSLSSVSWTNFRREPLYTQALLLYKRAKDGAAECHAATWGWANGLTSGTCCHLSWSQWL